MECPKCGYERQDGDTHCQMCNLDFGLWERQTAESKKLRERSRKHGEPSATKGLQLEETPDVTPQDAEPAGACPKCGFYRRKDDTDCPNCGVIYAKHEQMLEKKKVEDATLKKEADRKFAEEKARLQREAEKAITEENTKREAEARRQAELEVEKSRLAEQKSARRKARKATQQEKLGNLSQKLKKNPRKLRLVVAVCVAAVLLLGGGVYGVLVWQESAQQRRIEAEKEAAQRKLAEDHQRIAANFQANRSEIVSYLRSLIDKRKFDFFQKELKKYDIPPLADDVGKLKAYLEEISYFDKAKWIPAKEYQKNYEAYKQLVRMNPGNRVYKEKMAVYRKKWADQSYRYAAGFLKKEKRYKSDLEKAIAAIDKAIQLEGNKKQYGKVRYKLKTAELLFYEGNETAQMAVRNDGITKGATGGQRKIYTWIKNRGTESFFVNPDYFLLAARNNKRYKYNDCSRSLVVELQPGEEAHGYLYFYTSSKPKELIFNHINAGRISRRFP